VHAQHELASYFKGRDHAATEIKIVCQESADNVHRAMEVLRGLDRMTVASCASKQLAGELLHTQRTFVERMMKHGLMSEKNAHHMLKQVEADEVMLEQARHYQARAVGRMVGAAARAGLAHGNSPSKADAANLLRANATFHSTKNYSPINQALRVARKARETVVHVTKSAIGAAAVVTSASKSAIGAAAVVTSAAGRRASRIMSPGASPRVTPGDNVLHLQPGAVGTKPAGMTPLTSLRRSITELGEFVHGGGRRPVRADAKAEVEL